VLAKYKVRLRFFKPFVEIGPSFRWAGSAPTLSSRGVAAGLGLEFRLAVLHVSPGVRYTHWANGTPNPGYPIYSNRDQIEALVGLSF
jgi:hypothetical protein